MTHANQSPELTGSIQSPAEAVAYDLRGLVEGTSAFAPPLSEVDTVQIQALLENIGAVADVEYPKARSVLQPRYPDPFKFPEWTLHAEQSSPNPGKGSRRPQGQPAVPHPGTETGPLSSFGAEKQSGGGPPSQEILARAAGAGAVGVIGLGLLIVSLTDSIPLWTGLTALLLAACAAVAVWPGKRRPDSATLASRIDPQAPELWALRVGAGLKEAVEVGLRTGGVGLLVQPASPSEKSSEAEWSEQANSSASTK